MFQFSKKGLNDNNSNTKNNTNNHTYSFNDAHTVRITNGCFVTIVKTNEI